jgi:hypothetical protein
VVNPLKRTRETVELYSGDLAELVNGRLRPASVQVVEDPSEDDGEESTGVDWRGNQFISD